MMLRKRAWDIMRDDFIRIEESEPLSKVIKILNENLEKKPDYDFVVVLSKTGVFRGILTTMDVMRGMGPCLAGIDLGENEGLDYEHSCLNACRLCSQVDIKEVMRRDVPRVKPGDPLSLVMQKMFDYRCGKTIVEEGEKMIGIVMKKDLYLEIARDVDKW